LNATHGYLANWTEVIDAYHHSVETFLEMSNNLSLLVSFEELVYEKYSRNSVLKILNFVDKPKRMVDRALSVINSR
jgi:hypothetical protein